MEPLLPSTRHRYKRILAHAEKFVDEAYSNPDVKFVDFLDEFGYTGRTVQRALEYLGTSWKKLVLDARMEEAKFLLVHTDLAYGVVAVKVGYKTPSLFTDVFKNYVGITPSQYRQEQRHG